ncbi:hypothetical protein H2203_003818 [Taxawa tesnikishii (nom. ined.)]|nr:hypothetical protein H2203_003818 [Dothideales sp. JES 119]
MASSSNHNEKDSLDKGHSVDKSRQSGDVAHLEHTETIGPIPTAELPNALAEQWCSRSPVIPYVFGAAFLASLGGYSFGYDQGVISIINVMPQFIDAYPEIGKGGFYTGFMTAMLELGAFIGCFFMPKLADKISRKWALSVVVVIFTIGAIIQTAAPNYGALVAGRFICGIGVGTLAMGAPIYISEIAPRISAAPSSCLNPSPSSLVWSWPTG